MNFVFLLTQLLLVCLQVRDSNSWLINPDGKSGPITVTTTEADLKRLFGAQNVRDDKIHVGEGGFESGTVVFPEDPLKRLELLWSDVEGKRFPKTIFLGGFSDTDPKKSLWHTTYGITLGTTLSELEQINRRPFRLAGFQWDYSGTVLSWSGGTLEDVFGSDAIKKAYLRLMYSTPVPPESAAVVGDRNFSSGHPAMQKINPHVYQIVFRFGRPS